MSDLRSILTDIHQRRGLDSATLVEEATPTDHPLHDRFEWDDSIAGPRYRLVQAAQIIRSVRIVFTTTGDEPKSIRAFVSRESVPLADDEDDDLRRMYLPTDEALIDPLVSRILLRQMERDAKAFRDKYSHMKEYAAVVRAQLLDGLAS